MPGAIAVIPFSVSILISKRIQSRALFSLAQFTRRFVICDKTQIRDYYAADVMQ